MNETNIELGIKYFNEEFYEKALSVFLKLSKDMNAQYYLGAIYRMGLGVKDDQKEAFNWFLKSAKQGHVESMYLVGSAYAGSFHVHNQTDLVKINYDMIEDKSNMDNSIWQDDLSYLDLNGIGIEPSNEMAYKWMLRAAQEGYVEAQASLGYFYEFGTGVKEDEEEAVKWYQKAAEKDNVKAIKALAYYYYSKGDFVKSIDGYKKAYRLGDAYAAFTIGKRYEKVDSINQDYEKAIKWYLISAKEFNYFEAYNKLGNLYYEGMGVTKDILKAVEYYEQAMKYFRFEGPVRYIYGLHEKLFQLNKEGYKTSIDTKEMIKYLEYQANLGYDDARIELRKFYDKGFEVSEKNRKMFDLLSKAESGDKQAQLNYGNTYLLESILDQTTKLKIREWFLDDAVSGVVDAQYMLAKAYTGYDTNPEYDYWLKKAADRGHSRAQYEIAIMYGNEKPDRLLKYMKMASKTNVDAQIDLGYRYAHGDLAQIDYYEAFRLYQLAASNMKRIKDVNLLRSLNYVKLRYNAANDEAEVLAHNGDISAQLYMGCLYQYGFEVKRNLDKSIYWYKMANKQGSREAQIQLEIIHKDLNINYEEKE